MTQDKAIEEVRSVRQQISEAYSHDIKAFMQHYRDLENQYKERLIGQRESVTMLLREQTVAEHMEVPNKGIEPTR